jgi:5-methylcytosine-specific restriction protein A
VTPEFVWQAVQELLDGASFEPFGPSTDYDLIADNDVRLPPKAVFGRAASYALKRDIEPKHFSGDNASLCFRLLRAADYQVLPKGSTVPKSTEGEQDEWEEGRPVLRSHKARERAPGLAKAKKAQYLRLHKVLKCEACGMVPTAHYNTSLAESCIEIHHKATAVSEMVEGHRSKLEDVECLCANCHRLEHRRMRENKKAIKEEA